jgi:hypothetical protein
MMLLVSSRILVVEKPIGMPRLVHSLQFMAIKLLTHTFATPGNHGAGIEQGISYWVSNGNAQNTALGTFLTVYSDAYLATPGNHGAGIEQGIGCWVANGNAQNTALVHSLRFMATLVPTHTLQPLAIMVLVSSRVLVVE